jgi:hypothetical protein
MSLADLAAIGSFASAVAVLISLIYLARQVRQAERNQRAILQQGRAARSVDTLLRLAAPDTVGAYWLGSDGDEAITEREFQQFALVYQAIMSGFEDTWFQHEAGMLADAAYESTAAAVKSRFALPGYRAMHRMAGGRRDPGFKRLCDGLAAGADRSNPPDSFEIWKALVAEEKARPVAP